MSERSMPPDDSPEVSAEPQPDGSKTNPTEVDKVGPGRPPKHRQWKKGCRSPNPRGRPRKDQSMAPDLKRALETALNKKVKVSEGEKKTVLTKAELGINQLVNRFAKGDRHACRDLMEIANRLGVDFQAAHRKAIEGALAFAPDHQAILDSYVARRTGAEVRPADRVIAPPELLDDDPVAPEPTLLPEPKPEGPPPPRPDPRAPRPFEQMSYTERRAWYPDWHEQHQQWLTRRRKP
jgi:uncharacterized protein DUF5681